MHKMWRFLKNDVHVCLCVSAGLLGGGPTTEEDHISAGESTSPSSALPGEDHGQSEVVVAASETLLHETLQIFCFESVVQNVPQTHQVTRFQQTIKAS